MKSYLSRGIANGSNGSFFDESSSGSFWFFVGGVFNVRFGSHAFHVFRVITIVIFDFPDLHVPHYIDDLQLSNHVVDKKLNSFHTQKFLQGFNVRSFIDNLHVILSPLFIENTVNTIFREANAELLEDMIADLHYFCTREGLHFHEGIACFRVQVPELSLIFSIGTSYFFLS